LLELAVFRTDRDVAASKFTEGAWIPVVLVPLIVTGFSVVHRYYARLERALAVVPGHATPKPLINTVVVMVGQLHLGVLNALN
jgi:hypothetical protein